MDDPDRLTADEMDERRHEQMAFEYLTRLNQVASWISECIGEDLPTGIQLEEVFPNGVFLAKLAHFYSPQTVSETKIFDVNQTRFEEHGLHFRHTDNIMHWIRAMRYYKFPEVFIPDTTDIYDSKNLPKAVFCLIALSLFLYRKGLAPPIRDDAQKEIHKEEVSQMAALLKERGIKLPNFSKIEGMLADELSLDQAQMHAAVVAVNEALDSGDADLVLNALREPAAGLHLIRDENKQDYMETLVEVKNDKCEQSLTKENNEGDLYESLLNRDELQECVDSVNVSQAHMSLIRSLLKGTPEETVKCLQDPVLRFPRVKHSAALLYHHELRRIQREAKGQLPLEQLAPHVKDLNVMVELNDAVTNDQPDKLIQILRSVMFTSTITEITEEELKISSTNYLLMLKKAKQNKCEDVCPYLTENDVRQTMSQVKQENDLDTKNAAAFRIQSSFKAYKQRNKHKDKVQHYKSVKGQYQITKAQAQVKMYLQRKQFQNRLKFMKEQEESVMKIQRFMRKNQCQRDLYSLTQDDNPRLAVVRRYASLLVETEIDYDEDLERDTLKKSMAQIIQSNRTLEEDLSVMDVKIGLLVKNRLGIEEVLKHGQRLSSQHDKRMSQDDDLSPSDETPKAAFKATLRSGSIMDKTNRGMLTHYQHLLYLLQVEPQYMAKLLLNISSAKLPRMLESVCLPLFNYAAQPREEYLLVRVLRQALLYDLRAKVNSINEFPTVNLTVPRLAAELSKQIYGEDSLRKIVTPLVEDMVKDKDEHINLNPLEIYRFVIGEPPEGMKADEAADKAEVWEVLDNSMAYLVKWADVFLKALTHSRTTIPYVIRYLGKVVRTELKDKLNTWSRDACKAVGYMIFSTYINPILSSPNSQSENVKLSPDDRKKLGNICKLLTYCALNQGYGDEYSYLSNLNQFIQTFHEKLRTYIENLIDVEEPEEVLGVDDYVDYTSNKKPSVIIPANELIFLHETVELHRKTLTSLDPGDALEEILKSFEAIPDVSQLLGGRKDIHTELNLQLSANRPDSQVNDAQNTLFLQTKKMVLDVIFCQPGSNLTEILNTPSNEQQESKHKELMLNNDENRKDRKSVLIADALLLSLEEKKEKVMENLDTLEEQNLVSSKDHYQVIVTAIAKDIRRENKYRKTRRAELERLKETLHRLQDSRSYKMDQLRQWNEYINACLENLAPKANRKRNSKVDSDVKPKLKTVVKTSGEKLLKKKIVRANEDCNEKELKNLQIEVTQSDTPGLFTFAVTKYKQNESVDSEILFQELLQMQYDEQEMVVLCGVAFLVDELVFYLNRKFYCS